MEYLIEELRRAQQERAELEARWIRFQNLYRSLPLEQIKRFPWIGASNLVMPVAATDIDIMVARLLGLILGQPNIWSCTALRPEMIDYAPRVEEFLQWAQDAELDAPNAITDWVLEICKLGTGVLKQRYTRQQKLVYEWREGPAGMTERQLRRLVKDNPILQRVPLADFYVPSNARNLAEAAWAGERFRLTEDQLLSRVRAGLYQLPTNWRPGTRSSVATRGADYERNQQRLDGFETGFSTDLEPYEFWVDFDLAGIGEPQALVCTIDIESRSYLRVDYNPFFNQEKPFSIARFIRQEGRIYGIGLCEILEQFQEAVSTMTNQRIDNATLMNMTMFKGKANAGIVENEPWYPGKVKLLANPETDLVPMNVGQKADTTIQNEELLMTYAQKRTGVNDWLGANSETGTNYATATTAVSMLKEGAKRGDQVLREIRGALSESGTRLLELYQQFNQGGKPYTVLGQKDGEKFDQVLHFPTDIVRMAVFIDITSTNGAVNKEVEIRTNQIIFGLLMQFYQQMIQGLMLTQNPQIPPLIAQVAMQMVQGGLKLMERILTSYGIQDADTLLPDLGQAVEQNAKFLQQFGPPQPPAPAAQPAVPGASGGSPMADGSAAPSGMAALLGSIAAKAAGSFAGSSAGNGASRNLQSAGRY